MQRYVFFKKAGNQTDFIFWYHFWYQNLDADVAAYLKNGIILQATIRLMPPELQTKWYQKNLK